MDIYQKIQLDEISQTEFTMQCVEQEVVFFVLEGSIEILIAGEILTVHTNEIFIVNQAQMIGMTGAKNNLVLLVYLDFAKQLLPGESIKIDKPISSVYYQELYGEMTQLLSSLYIENVEKNRGYETFITGYLEQLNGLILRFLPIEVSHTAKENQPINEKTSAIMSYLKEHYQEEISLDKLSEKFYMSKFYLAHSFKKQVGMSIGNYLKEIRLLNAIKMLKQTNYPITDIAYHHGFSSARAFVEVFKQKNGISPVQYRKKQETSKMIEQKKVVNRDYLELFTRFVKGDTSDLYTRMDIVEKNIQLNHQGYPRSNYQYLIKMSSDKLDSHLDWLSSQINLHFVAVDQLLDKIEFKWMNEELYIDFTELEKELRLLTAYRLRPYLQISIYDYEVYRLKQPSISFKQVMKQLKLFLESNFSLVSEWYLEFRPYYEYNGTGELCEPIKEVISLFRQTCRLVIHLPKQPIVNVTAEELVDMVEVIDDYTRVASFPLKVVLEQLGHQRYIELIQENQNVVYQKKLFEGLIKLEKDPYYQQFDELIYANFMLWIFFYSLDVTSEKNIQPVSIDGKPNFLYFEKELSQKLAMISPMGIYSDVWYSFLFIEKLYNEIIFKNDYCIVTRRGEHYRILLIHSDNFMENLAKLREGKEARTHYQQPTVFVNVSLEDIKGQYRISKQELTPYIKLMQKKQLDIRNDVKLFPDDVDYINQVRQPSRQIKNIEIVDKYVIEEEIPLLSVKYIELIKIK